MCTLERLARGLSRPFGPDGREVPLVDGIKTRPINATLAKQTANITINHRTSTSTIEHQQGRCSQTSCKVGT